MNWRELAKDYDDNGGGGNKFRLPHFWKHYRKTAGWEALQLCRKFFPWRAKDWYQ